MIESDLPDSVPELKLLVQKLLANQDKIESGFKEALQRLVEEKHMSIEKLKDRIQYDKQTATIAYLRARVNRLEIGVKERESFHRKNLNDMAKQHSEQIQSILKRSYETERAFQESCARTSEFFEGETDPSILSQLKDLDERCKLAEKLKAMIEKENSDLRADVYKLRGALQEEVLKKLEEKRVSRDEKDESEGLVIFIETDGSEKRIKGATPDKLIERLLDPLSFDNKYLQAFMLTYPAFMTSRSLMDLIAQKHREFMAIKSKMEDKGYQTPIILRFVNAIKTWLEGYWSDFQEDPTLVADINSLLETIKDEKLNSIVKSVLTRKLTNEDQSHQLVKSTPPKAIVPKQLMKRYSPENQSVQATIKQFDDVKLNILDIDPLEMARQLTLMEAELFVNIKPREFLDMAWMKDNKEIKSPNITRMVHWSNHVVQWIATEILSVKENHKLRAQVFERIISLGHQLEKLNNFNGVREVLAAIESSAIYRLKKTKSLVGAKHMKMLDDLLRVASSEHNYKNLRARIHSANPPIIPFPGVYQSDLVFLSTCNKNILDGGLVNFHKFQKEAGYILEFQTYQKTLYNFEVIVEIQDMVKSFKVFTEEEAYSHSLLCEPRQG
ncbi:ras GEF [Rhizoclosmatium globosum]|uniref:Ras GEF n=1 Tax=Rhizoclosmatium globosum TaxID=329046 RepID=A0A1Y2CY70_9FUNG|nr:ras GEF [Rhizoclosmatium globosum]|eukprot:ORY51927.1 ras GEF [Rhizoclosmatium globosum]